MHVDAIVNAANTGLLRGSGVCGAIFEAAGVDEMTAACRALSPIKTGEAVMTPGFALPARFVIHTAGPVYNIRDKAACEARLRSSYRNSLALALSKQCRSIAFPLISSGIFGYPKEAALQVARSEIRSFLTDQDMEVYLVIYDEASFVPNGALLDDLDDFLSEKEQSNDRQGEALVINESIFSLQMDRSVEAAAGSAEIEPLLHRMDMPFNTALLKLIDARKMKDSEVYRRANIDRRLFSKIRKGGDYLPGKRTILALAIALRLSLEETSDLLKKAGYAFSESLRSDVIVQYFILQQRYDIDEINEALFFYHQPLLGQN